MILFQWSTPQLKEEAILQEVQHNSSGVNTLIKKGIVLEEIKPTLSVLITEIKKEFIASEFDSATLQQEYSDTKGKLIVTKPEYEGCPDEVFYIQKHLTLFHYCICFLSFFQVYCLCLNFSYAEDYINISN